jgi:hypothetical protein
MFIVAVTAAVVAYRQLRSSKQESRRATAYSAYKEFLKLCFDYPDFAYGNEDSIKECGNKYVQYRWFIAQMLFTFEQVLEVLPDDREWNTTIANQLRKHIWHLQGSSSVKREEWSKPLMKLLDNSLN